MRARHAVASLFVWSFALLAGLVVPGGVGVEPAVAAQACWAPENLRAAPSEAGIRQGVRRAFLPPPKGVPVPFTAIPAAKRGVIRRVTLPPGKKLVALTFDFCEQPHEIAGYQGDIIDFLRAENIRATLFMGGKWMATHPERTAQLMTDTRFELANHTWEHRNLRRLSGSTLTSEIENAQLAYEAAHTDLAQRRCVVPGTRELAHKLAPKRMTLFRFPFGACNARSLDAVGDLGLTAVQWDVSSGDPWIGQKSGAMADLVLKAVRPGSIVLFHANGRGYHTGGALPKIVKGLRAAGYEFVTVSDLLKAGTPEYADPAHGCYDARPGDTDKYDKLAAQLEGVYAQAKAAAFQRAQVAVPEVPSGVPVPADAEAPPPVLVQKPQRVYPSTPRSVDPLLPQ